MMPSSSTGWKRDFRACSSCELYKCNHEILHVQSQMYLSSHSPSGFCQQASSCAGLRKPSASLYLKQYSSVTIFRDVRVDFFFPPKQSLRVPHRVLTVCFIPYVSAVIITPGWFTLLSKCIRLDVYCGELSNCITPNSPCWLRHGWCLTFTPLCQEKGHCYELMTEQCSAMFDYPAFYLCLPPPFLVTIIFFQPCCLLSFSQGFAALTVIQPGGVGVSTDPLLLAASCSF